MIDFVVGIHDICDTGWDRYRETGRAKWEHWVWIYAAGWTPLETEMTGQGRECD